VILLSIRKCTNAVYGAWVVPPLGWRLAGLVWGYALVWFLATDPIKILAYKVLDRIQARQVVTAGSSRQPTVTTPRMPVPKAAG
jgi:hypothetical protein